MLWVLIRSTLPRDFKWVHMICGEIPPPILWMAGQYPANFLLFLHENIPSKCFQAGMRNITETHLYNFDPLKSHFYIVKLGFTGVYIFFLTSAQNHGLWVLIRTERGSSNKYPQSMF